MRYTPPSYFPKNALAPASGSNAGSPNCHSCVGHGTGVTPGFPIACGAGARDPIAQAIATTVVPTVRTKALIATSLLSLPSQPITNNKQPTEDQQPTNNKQPTNDQQPTTNNQSAHRPPRQRERRDVRSGPDDHVLPSVNRVRHRRREDRRAGLILKQLLAGRRVGGEEMSFVIAAENNATCRREDAGPPRARVADLPLAADGDRIDRAQRAPILVLRHRCHRAAHRSIADVDRC